MQSRADIAQPVRYDQQCRSTALGSRYPRLPWPLLRQLRDQDVAGADTAQLRLEASTGHGKAQGYWEGYSHHTESGG